MYEIEPKDDSDLPGSYGLAFTDGSKYHVRIPIDSIGWIDNTYYVQADSQLGEEELIGKTITAASLLHCESDVFGFSVDPTGTKEYEAVGIKVDVSDKWIRFYGFQGPEDELARMITLDDEDECGGDPSTNYFDAFLVRVAHGRRRGGRH